MMRKSPCPRAAFLAAFLAITLSSCEKYAQTFKEKATLEASVQKAREEMESYESKIASVGKPLPYASMDLESQIKTADKTNAELSLEATDLRGKAERMEAAVSEFRPKVEAYAAKHLR